MASAVDRRFEVVWFGGPKSSPLQPEHFKRLLKKSRGRGHFLVMPTTDHQDEIEASGNLLAFYYSEVNQVHKGAPIFPVVTAPQMIDRITHAYGAQGFHSGWIFLNEISSKFWPAQAAYREWLIEIVSGLALRGLTPVIFSPFPAPPKNRDDWKAVSEHAYIAVENYLGGHDVAGQKASAARWCEGRYRQTMTTYTGHGVPAEKVFVTEHFGHTKLVGTVRRGRCSIPMAQWLDAIDARTLALQKIGFGGFVSFAWMYNQLGAPLADLVRATDRYLARRLP